MTQRLAIGSASRFMSGSAELAFVAVPRRGNKLEGAFETSGSGRGPCGPLLLLAAALLVGGCAEDSGTGFDGVPSGPAGMSGAAGEPSAGDGGLQMPPGTPDPVEESRCVPAAMAVGANAVTNTTPRLSLSRPVASGGGAGDAAPLVDGRYHQTAVSLGAPTAEAPAWVAIDLVDEPAAGPSRVLAVWKDAGWEQYTTAIGGAPGAYTIEVSADSTDGEDGTWTEAVSVVDNTVNNRAHSLDFTGQRWLKLVVTAVAEGGSAVQLDELTVHDVSSSPTGVIDDTWVFFGDSITQLAFRRDLATAASFDAQSQERQAERFPAFVNAGVGGDTLPLALARLDQVLELNADMKYFALGFGTNDAWNNSDPSTVAFEDNLRQLIVGIQAAGRVPVLARIPFAGDANATPASTHIGLPAYNDVVDALQAEFGLPCGPDLYELFAQAPSGLGGDGVHPNLVGYASMNAAWADRAQSLYVGAQ